MQHDAMQPSAPRRALRPRHLLRCPLHGCQTHKRWAVPTLAAGAALPPAFAPPLSRESLVEPHKARSLSMLHSGMAMAGDSTCNNNPRSVNRCGGANACPGKFLVPDRRETNAAVTAQSPSSSIPLPASPCACPQEDRINAHDTVQLCMHAAPCKNSRTQ